MFKNYSSEQIARMVSAIFLLLGLFGFKSELSEGQIVSAIDSLVLAAALLVGFILNVYGYIKRWSKGDVSLLGKRI